MVNVVTANTGIEAMLYLDNNPDITVVISDMQMPGLTGLEFIQQAHMKYPKKSYYLLTGMDDTKEINHALSSGMIKKCFKKPLDYEEILGVMKH
jgi:response regulator RpfG family c-di-GMP phosphodiesterase